MAHYHWETRLFDCFTLKWLAGQQNRLPFKTWLQPYGPRCGSIVCSHCHNTRVLVIGTHCVLGRSFQVQWKWILASVYRSPNSSVNTKLVLVGSQKQFSGFISRFVISAILLSQETDLCIETGQCPFLLFINFSEPNLSLKRFIVLMLSEHCLQDLPDDLTTLANWFIPCRRERKM